MAENIIYEDTPFAEYLAEIGQEEELVKQPEPAEILRKDSRSEQVPISLIQRFKHDLIEYLNENLSMGLPSLEESSFEELFKYLICTSHLLNDTLSIYFYDTKKPPPLETKDIDIGAYCYGFSRNSFEILLSSIIGLASIFATWLLLLDVHQEGFMTKIARLIIPFTFSVLISFMTYLYLRRKSMRTLHRLALHYLKVLVYNCQALDLKINKALIMIQEIELISRGYRLSMPLSPISRIEQHSKNRRCLTLRETIYSILKKAIDSYKDSIKDLQPVVSQNNLTIMYNMYNINSCSENDLEEEYDEVNDEEKDENDKLSLENLKQYFQKMHSKRRECLCHLLALDVMTAGRDSNRRDYEVHWSTINDHLNSLATVLGHYFDKITLALTSEPYTISTSKQDFMSQSSPMAVSNKKLRSYIHRLASVEQHIRVIQAKLYICNEDARENFDIEGAAGEDEKNKLLNNYESINKDFTYMFQEWEEGMKVLRGMIESTSSDADSSSRRPSLDEDAETLKDETDHEENNYEKHVVDWSQVDGPFDVPEQVFIAEAEPEITKKKMTREERIAIQKTKREEEAKAKAARMDSERMVHELKDVLVRRKPKSSEDELSPQKITTAVEATTTTTTTD